MFRQRTLSLLQQARTFQNAGTGAPAGMVNFQSCYFGARTKYNFGTETPATSNKYQRGLYHGKTHGQRKQRCFSMKYSLVTMKPNIMRRTFFSQILGMNLRLWVSMKARRTIMKRGSFDNYIMKTKTAHIDSKFGLYLRTLMKQKLKNPQFAIPIIAGTHTQARTRKTKYWAYRNVPSIYMPAGQNMTEDHTKLYMKTPQEMSRHEIAELEKELREMTERGFEDNIPDEVCDAAFLEDPQRKLILSKMKQLTKVRHGVIKRYFEKYKYRKHFRNDIIKAAEETEDVMQEVLGKDHVHFLDANPEIREFMEQVNKDQAMRDQAALEKKGKQIGDLPDIKRLQIKPADEAPKKKKKKPLVAFLQSRRFDQISSSDEEEGRKLLSKRGFDLSEFKGLGIDLESLEEVTSTTDSATESHPEHAASTSDETDTVTATDSAASAVEDKFEAAQATTEEVTTEGMTSAEEVTTEEVTAEETKTEEVSETEAETETDAATTEAETTSKEEEVEVKEEEKKEPEEKQGWFSSLFGRKK